MEPSRFDIYPTGVRGGPGWSEIVGAAACVGRLANGLVALEHAAECSADGGQRAREPGQL